MKRLAVIAVIASLVVSPAHAVDPVSKGAGKTTVTLTPAAPTGSVPKPGFAAPATAYPFLSTVWLVPEIHVGGVNTAVGHTSLNFFNPSLRPITPTILLLDPEGALRGPVSRSLTSRLGPVPAGGTRWMPLIQTGPDTVGLMGWAIVMADRPFAIVAADYEFKVGEQREKTMSRTLPVHAIDCGRPAGIEYVCSFLSSFRSLD